MPTCGAEPPRSSSGARLAREPSDRTEPGVLGRAFLSGAGCRSSELRPGEGLSGRGVDAPPAAGVRPSPCALFLGESTVVGSSTANAAGTATAATALTARAIRRRARRPGPRPAAADSATASCSPSVGDSSAEAGVAGESGAADEPGACGAGGECGGCGSCVDEAAGTVELAVADVARLRLRASSARIQRRCSSTSSSAVAPHRLARRSTGAKSFGTASPLQYRCNVDTLMCNCPARTP